jgi:hypothetical protein
MATPTTTTSYAGEIKARRNRHDLWTWVTIGDDLAVVRRNIGHFADQFATRIKRTTHEWGADGAIISVVQETLEEHEAGYVYA